MNCITSDCYLKHLERLFLAHNWLWIVTPVAVCCILAYWIDMWVVIVMLIVLMLVLTLILSLNYLYYCLSPEAHWSIMEKTVTIDDEGITLQFTDKLMNTRVIHWDDVRHIIVKKDVVMLILRGSRYRCLMLPASVVDPDVAQRLRQFVPQAH